MHTTECFASADLFSHSGSTLVALELCSSLIVVAEPNLWCPEFKKSYNNLCVFAFISAH